MNTLSEQLAPQGNYLTDFLMRQNNKAISFTREDMDGDTNSTVMMLYIMIALLAFIFALMTFSTIESEAGAIGTLRASGYTKGEIIRHYMAAPTYVFLAAAVIGNIGGYTCFVNSWRTCITIPTLCLYSRLSGMQTPFCLRP